MSAGLWAALGALRFQIKSQAKSLELTLPQAWLLPIVAAEGPATPTILARRTDLSLPAMTSALEHLESKGLVVRTHSDDDRRRVLVTLSPKGRRTLAVLQRRNHANHERVNRLFTAPERNRLVRDLHRIATALGDGDRLAPGRCSFCQSREG